MFHKVYLCELDSSLVSQSLGPRSLVLFVLVTKSLLDLFLILGVIRSPIFVGPFSVVLQYFL